MSARTSEMKMQSHLSKHYCVRNKRCNVTSKTDETSSFPKTKSKFVLSIIDIQHISLSYQNKVRLNMPPKGRAAQKRTEAVQSRRPFRLPQRREEEKRKKRLRRYENFAPPPPPCASHRLTLQHTSDPSSKLKPPHLHHLQFPTTLPQLPNHP
jgi:hypothetical protein